MHTLENHTTIRNDTLICEILELDIIPKEAVYNIVDIDWGQNKKNYTNGLWKSKTIRYWTVYICISNGKPES